jgi:hypothetical protein
MSALKNDINGGGGGGTITSVVTNSTAYPATTTSGVVTVNAPNQLVNSGSNTTFGSLTLTTGISNIYSSSTYASDSSSLVIYSGQTSVGSISLKSQYVYLSGEPTSVNYCLINNGNISFQKSSVFTANISTASDNYDPEDPALNSGIMTIYPQGIRSVLKLRSNSTQFLTDTNSLIGTINSGGLSINSISATGNVGASTLNATSVTTNSVTSAASTDLTLSASTGQAVKLVAGNSTVKVSGSGSLQIFNPLQTKNLQLISGNSLDAIISLNNNFYIAQQNTAGTGYQAYITMANDTNLSIAAPLQITPTKIVLNAGITGVNIATITSGITTFNSETLEVTGGVGGGGAVNIYNTTNYTSLKSSATANYTLSLPTGIASVNGSPLVSDTAGQLTYGQPTTTTSDVFFKSLVLTGAISAPGGVGTTRVDSASDLAITVPSTNTMTLKSGNTGYLYVNNNGLSINVTTATQPDIVGISSTGVLYRQPAPVNAYINYFANSPATSTSIETYIYNFNNPDFFSSTSQTLVNSQLTFLNYKNVSNKSVSNWVVNQPNVNSEGWGTNSASNGLFYFPAIGSYLINWCFQANSNLNVYSQINKNLYFPPLSQPTYSDSTMVSCNNPQSPGTQMTAIVNITSLTDYITFTTYNFNPNQGINSAGRQILSIIRIG